MRNKISYKPVMLAFSALAFFANCKDSRNSNIDDFVQTAPVTHNQSTESNLESYGNNAFSEEYIKDCEKYGLKPENTSATTLKTIMSGPEGLIFDKYGFYPSALSKEQLTEKLKDLKLDSLGELYKSVLE